MNMIMNMMWMMIGAYMGFHELEVRYKFPNETIGLWKGNSS